MYYSFDNKDKNIINNYCNRLKHERNECRILLIDMHKIFKQKNIEKHYDDSIYALIEYVYKNEKYPSEVIWNRLAIEKNYLLAETIGYIYGYGFNKLCRKIIREIKKV